MVFTQKPDPFFKIFWLHLSYKKGACFYSFLSDMLLKDSPFSHRSS